MKIIKMSAVDVVISGSFNIINRLKINDLLSIIDNKTDNTLIYKINQIVLAENTIQNITDEELDIFCQPGTVVAALIGSIFNGKFNTGSFSSISLEDYKVHLLSGFEIERMLAENIPASLEIGKYSDYNLPAKINFNNLLRRHSAILGNTGSGKSETVAKILEKINFNAKKEKVNLIIFDFHGEYSDIDFVDCYKLAENFNFPLSFFTINEILTNIFKLKEEVATTLFTAVKKAYQNSLLDIKGFQLDFGADFPFPLDVDKFFKSLEFLDEQMIETNETYKTGENKGMYKWVKGEYNGKLTNIINQLIGLKNDNKYAFLFKKVEQEDFVICEKLVSGKGIRSIDFSGVPHGIAVSIISVLTKLIYNYQVNMLDYKNNPVFLICDEAHIYIPNEYQLQASQKRAIKIFEKIAKEGRKFGINMLIASQRPSELNKTILAQCANFIVLKLNNENDKTIIENMLPAGNAEVIENTATFLPGDCFVIGDASPIILKTHIALAEQRPNSETINIWEKWEG